MGLDSPYEKWNGWQHSLPAVFLFGCDPIGVDTVRCPWEAQSGDFERRALESGSLLS
jgi:hypothetical protein